MKNKEVLDTMHDVKHVAVSTALHANSPKDLGEMVGTFLSTIPTNPDVVWLSAANMYAIYVNILKKADYKSFMKGFKTSASFPEVILDDDVSDDYAVSAIKNTLFKCIHDMMPMVLYHDSTTRHISASYMTAQDLVAVMCSKYIKSDCAGSKSICGMLINATVRNIEYLNNVIPGQFSNKRNHIRSIALSGMTVDMTIKNVYLLLNMMYEYSKLSISSDCPLGYNHNYGIYNSLSTMHAVIEAYRSGKDYAATTMMKLVAYHSYLRCKDTSVGTLSAYDPPKWIYNLSHNYDNFAEPWSCNSMLQALILANDEFKNCSANDVAGIINALMEHYYSLKKKGGNKNV